MNQGNQITRIKNLRSRLSEAGKIKIGIKGAQVTSSGGKEFRPPKKLDHFIIVTTERDADGNYMIDNALMDAIKSTGGEHVCNADGNL